MGSSPSRPASAEVPASPNHTNREGNSSSPRRSNRQGFQEVEIQTPNSARGAQPSEPPPVSSRSNLSPTDSVSPTVQNSIGRPLTDSARPSVPGNADRREIADRMEDADRHLVVARIQREKTVMNSELDIPKYRDNDIHFETFYHMNGREFNVIYQDGKRHMIDVTTGHLSPFPTNLYKKGLLVTTDLNNQQRDSNGTASTNGISLNVEEPMANDREGVIELPNKSRIETLMIEKRINVNHYFDKRQGIMVCLPLAWELHSPVVKSLMEPIEEALPDWQDKYDMLATLRACNYDPGQCIDTYLTVGETGISHPKNAADANLMLKKDEEIVILSNDVQSLQVKVNSKTEAYEKELGARKMAEKKAHFLQEKVSTLEADLASAVAKLESLQRERPKTAAQKKAAAVFDPLTLQSVNKQTRNLHKSHKNLQMEAAEFFGSFKKMLYEVRTGFDKIRQSDSGAAQELEDMRELYRKEALQRKFLYNTLQELRGNIRVFLRCRHDSRSKCCLRFPTDTEVITPNSKKPYTFDKVYSPQSTQEEVYEDTRPIITSCVDGYNVCILAYGQTGSGKTFTMQGPADSPGVNVRSLMELLEICQSRDNMEYTLKASMIEIYNEAVHDLLSPAVNNLDVRAQGNKIVLPGMIEMEVRSIKDIDEIMKLGGKHRAVASTKMNSQSSRSHLIFMVVIQGRDKSTGATSAGTLTLCDLAGSERVSKSEATGQRLAEAAAINKSLSSLGQVFTALRTGQLHVPYRNSKLTHILQPSLGGDAKACLFVMTSPDIDNISETTSTIQFGSNAQHIQLGQAKKNVTKGNASVVDN